MTFHEMDAAICKRALLTFRLIMRRAGPDDSDHIDGDWLRIYRATAFELGMPDAISPLIRESPTQSRVLFNSLPD